MVAKKSAKKVEEKKETPKKTSKKFDFKKNIWAISTAVLAVVLLIVIATSENSCATGAVISSTDAGQKVVELIEMQGTEAQVISVDDQGSIYEVVISIDGQEGPIYITKDGNDLIQSKISIEQIKQQILAAQKETQPEVKEIPKSEKPVVQLFVMSYCPFGVKAGNNIIPLVNLLGDSVDFKMRYIVNAGDSVEKSSSLHGVYEAKQDAVQLIIRENYPDKFWDYIKAFNENCYQIGYQDTESADTCWKSEVTKLGIDANEVESLAYGEEGLSLLKEEQAIMQQYGASGSPTLVINDVESDSVYYGTESMQDALCNAFNEAPSSCAEQLESVSQTTTGSC